MTTYPGGKNGSGVYQTIINQMPPHAVYIEAFLGGGAILRNKRPAPIANIAMDADAAVLQEFKQNFDGVGFPELQIWNEDAIGWLNGALILRWPGTLVYLDPPYLMSTRRQNRQIYRYEMSDDDHIRLLDIILRLPCMVMISGYYSEMYAAALQDWRAIQFQARTRGGGTATEWLWMNFPQPFELHDYRFLGDDFRERERIKRKKTRWLSKLRHMAPLERYAILNAIQELRDPATPETAMVAGLAEGNDEGLYRRL